jgi:hypothetical protein
MGERREVEDGMAALHLYTVQWGVKEIKDGNAEMPSASEISALSSMSSK